MKSRSKNIISVFLALIVFVSSNGIVVAAHNCFSGHKTEVSLFEKECCTKGKEKCHSKPAEENTFTKKCCELKITYHKIDVKTPLAKTSSIGHFNFFPTQLLFSSASLFPGDIFSFVFNKAPPLIHPGNALLISISTLQI